MSEKRYLHNFPAARQLRRPQTDTENLLWERLRDRRFQGRKFRRQHPVGAYVVDFYCAELGLAIEVDGSIHNDDLQRERDRDRQSALESLGLTFFRVSADDVEHRLDGVLVRLAAACPPPGPHRATPTPD